MDRHGAANKAVALIDASWWCCYCSPLIQHNRICSVWQLPQWEWLQWQRIGSCLCSQHNRLYGGLSRAELLLLLLFLSSIIFIEGQGHNLQVAHAQSLSTLMRDSLHM